MSCNYLPNEIDSMFDTEANDINNDTMLSDKLIWNNDNLSIASNDVAWDTIYDDLPSHTFDQINDKHKEKYFDIDFHLNELNDIFDEPPKTSIKLEPTHTNSVSSSYLTDDGSSPNSSNNNSPVGRKVKKRDFHTFDSSSEKSFALYDEGGNEHHPLKSAKIEPVTQQQPPPTIMAATAGTTTARTIYKFSRDNAKLEAREPIMIGTMPNQRQIVKIRPNNSSSNAGTAAQSFVFHHGSIKSVNISKYSQQDHHNHNNNNNNFSSSSSSTRTTNSSSLSNNHNFHSSSLSSQHQQQFDSPNLLDDNDDCDILADSNYFDEESCGENIYDDYKPARVGSFLSVINSNSNTIFQTPRGSHSNTLFQTPIPQSGPLYLTEEEKRTLLQENYPIPTRVPLTKQEERNLKKVRRKIKNKLSAQESRRKKKEYVDALEKKVEVYEQERIESKRRIETLENQQRTLQNQIRHYQHQLMNKITGTGNTTSTGLMLFMVCFALIMVGNSFPSSYRAMNLPQSSLISRSSLYHMGYGPARGALNDSKQVLLQSINIRNQPNRLINPSLEIDIIPRQSILLGEDNDDRNFEELIMSYRKSNKKICDNTNNYLIDSPIKSIELMKNNSYQRFNSHQDMIISRISNINLVK